MRSVFAAISRLSIDFSVINRAVETASFGLLKFWSVVGVPRRVADPAGSLDCWGAFLEFRLYVPSKRASVLVPCSDQSGRITTSRAGVGERPFCPGDRLRDLL